jgi:hypothetical protein
MNRSIKIWGGLVTAKPYLSECLEQTIEMEKELDKALEYIKKLEADIKDFESDHWPTA